jgi:hypothetical protein
MVCMKTDEKCEVVNAHTCVELTFGPSIHDWLLRTSHEVTFTVVDPHNTHELVTRHFEQSRILRATNTSSHLYCVISHIRSYQLGQESLSDTTHLFEDATSLAPCDEQTTTISS